MTQSNDLFMYLFSMCAVDKLIVWLFKCVCWCVQGRLMRWPLILVIMRIWWRSRWGSIIWPPRRSRETCTALFQSIQPFRTRWASLLCVESSLHTPSATPTSATARYHAQQHTFCNQYTHSSILIPVCRLPQAMNIVTLRPAAVR